MQEGGMPSTHILLLILAVFVFAIGTLSPWFAPNASKLNWISLGLTFFAGAFLAGTS